MQHRALIWILQDRTGHWRVWGRGTPRTDGTDDACVPGRDGWRVDVQAAHVLQKCVGHGCVQLLGLDEGGPGFAVGLWHGF